jgi:hypothetical protein
MRTELAALGRVEPRSNSVPKIEGSICDQSRPAASLQRVNIFRANQQDVVVLEESAIEPFDSGETDFV